MDADTRAYYWDRLLRAHLRGADMTERQRQDLADAIFTLLPSDRKLTDAEKALSTAAAELVSGEYDVEAWVRYARANKVHDLNLEEYRAKQGIDVTVDDRPLEERLAALLGT